MAGSVDTGAVARCGALAERRGHVAVFQGPCGTLATSRRPRCAQPSRRGTCPFGPGLVDEDEPRKDGSEASDGFASAVDGASRPGGPCSRATRALSATPRRRKSGSSARCRPLTPRSDKSRSHKRLQRDVGFLRPQAFEEGAVRLNLTRSVAAHFCGLREPLRSTRSTHLMADDPLTPNRAAAARRLDALDHNRVDHPVAQILRIRSGHPCWPLTQPAG